MKKFQYVGSWGFSIDFAVVSVPLGYRKIPLTKISNRIQW